MRAVLGFVDWPWALSWTAIFAILWLLWAREQAPVRRDKFAAGFEKWAEHDRGCPAGKKGAYDQDDCTCGLLAFKQDIFGEFD